MGAEGSQESVTKIPPPQDGGDFMMLGLGIPCWAQPGQVGGRAHSRWESGSRGGSARG